jgi:uncharacterized protein YutE (UPF0331/DUF86 family)
MSMEMINKTIIKQNLKDLEIVIRELRKYQNRPLVDFENDISLLWTVEHGLQVAIQNILDIGVHILAAQSKPDWEGYTEVIDKLGTNEIIPIEFARKIRGMASFRNILVHEYATIDLEKLHQILNNNLVDFEEFIKYTISYLKM